MQAQPGRLRRSAAPWRSAERGGLWLCGASRALRRLRGSARCVAPRGGGRRLPMHGLRSTSRVMGSESPTRWSSVADNAVSSIRRRSMLLFSLLYHLARRILGASQAATNHLHHRLRRQRDGPLSDLPAPDGRPWRESGRRTLAGCSISSTRDSASSSRLASTYSSDTWSVTAWD